jgi:hypothetical protein
VQNQESCLRGCRLDAYAEPISCHGGRTTHERKHERLLGCECGRTYRLKTLLGLTPSRSELEEFTPLQRSLDALMRSNGALYGRKRAVLLHGGEDSLTGQPPEQENWINLQDPGVSEFLRGAAWRVETACQIVRPSPELVAAFEKRLDGFRDIEALRAQFVRGRPKDPPRHRRAKWIVRDVLRDGFDEAEVAFHVGIKRRTMRRIESE